MRRTSGEVLGPALAGVLAGGLAIGVATLLAGGVERIGDAGGQPSTLVAVGGAFVDRTPPWLKDFAVNTFGTHDKLALFVSMAVVLVLVCAALGVLTRARRTAGLVGFAVVGALGAAAVLSRPHASGVDVVPTLVGTLAGLWALSGLVRRREVTRADGVRGGIERRRVILAGVAIAAVAAVAAALGQMLGGKAAQAAQSRASVRVPDVADPVRVPAAAQLAVPGITPYIVPDNQFYRIDTALVVPALTTADWRLRVHGLVDREVVIDWNTLLSKQLQQALVTLTCVSNEVGGNLAGNAVWTGWPVRELLAMAGPRAGADMVLSTSDDGFSAGTPIQALTDGRNALLAIAMNGQPLPPEHGFPVRMVVPGLYGYVSATKWVVDLKVTTYAADVAYWTDRGWSDHGPVKTASRIDVPQAGSHLVAGRVAVAGVAWAQHRGIDAVEVRVDDGPWQRARLAAEPSIDAWRQWVLEWDAPKGNHTIAVRAVDGLGQLQTAVQAPPPPNGASGWHTITVNVA